MRKMLDEEMIGRFYEFIKTFRKTGLTEAQIAQKLNLINYKGGPNKALLNLLYGVTVWKLITIGKLPPPEDESAMKKATLKYTDALAVAESIKKEEGEKGMYEVLADFKGIYPRTTVDFGEIIYRFDRYLNDCTPTFEKCGNF